MKKIKIQNLSKKTLYFLVFLTVFFYSCKKNLPEENYDTVLFYKSDILNNLNQNILSRLYDAVFFNNYFKAFSIKDTNNYKGEIVVVKTKQNKILEISSMFYDGIELYSIPFYLIKNKPKSLIRPTSLTPFIEEKKSKPNYYSKIILSYNADTCNVSFYYLNKKKSFFLKHDNKEFDSVICVFNNELKTSTSCFYQNSSFFRVSSAIIKNNEYEFEYFDDNDTLIDINDFHKIKIVLDSTGNLVEEYFFNKKNQLNTNGKCFIKLFYDDSNRVIKEIIFKSSTNNIVDTSKYETCNYKYDSIGNLIKIEKEYSQKQITKNDIYDEFYMNLAKIVDDITGGPKEDIKEYAFPLTKDDTLLISNKMHDNTGTLSLIEFYDSIQNINKTIKWDYFFDDNVYCKETYLGSLLKTKEYFDKYNNGTIFNGYCKISYNYDTLNRLAYEQYYGLSIRPLNNGEGYCFVANIYDDNNNVISKVFKNKDEYSILYIYDENGNETNIIYISPYEIEKIEKNGILNFIPYFGKLDPIDNPQQIDTLKINKSEIYIHDNLSKFQQDMYEFNLCRIKLKKL